MRRFPRAGAVLLFSAVTLPAQIAAAQPTPADYDRALSLRDRWQHLTENLADPATWVDATRFHYRRTVKSGHEFVLVDAETREKRPPFDHSKLAAGLSRAAGAEYTAQRLPFNTFEFADGERAINVTMTGQGGVGRGSSYTCRLSDYSCASRQDGGGRGGRGGRPPPHLCVV